MIIFGAKVRINLAQVTTPLIWTKCAELSSLCWTTYQREWLSVSDRRCFSAPWLSSWAQHQQDASQTWLYPHNVCLHTVICQWVIAQVFRQIYKSLFESTTPGLIPSVCRQMLAHPSQSICKCWKSALFSFSPAALINLWKSACILQVLKRNLLSWDVFDGWAIRHPVKVGPFKHVQSPIKHVSAISRPFWHSTIYSTLENQSIFM